MAALLGSPFNEAEYQRVFKSMEQDRADALMVSEESEHITYRTTIVELIGLKVDVIVALNSLSGRAAKQATTTIPIVVPVMGDPVEDGLVASLARPGGNVTGLTLLGPQSSV